MIDNRSWNYTIWTPHWINDTYLCAPLHISPRFVNYCHFSHRNFTHVAGKIYKSHRTFLRSRHRRYLNVRVQIAVFYNSPCMCNIVTHISTAWPVLIVSSLSEDSCHYTFINLIHVFRARRKLVSHDVIRLKELK